MTTPDLKPPAPRKSRVSSLTLVILAVNIVPLLIMGLGVFYLDQYKQNLIRAAYTHLEQETKLVDVILQGNPENLDKIRPVWGGGRSLYYMDEKGQVLDHLGSFAGIGDHSEEDSPGVLNFADTFATLFVILNPLRTSLPEFPRDLRGPLTEKLPEVKAASMGIGGLSAWSYNGSFILTSAIPTKSSRSEGGASRIIMLIMGGDEITHDINEVRRDIIKAFIIVIILTFLLSIYLSSFIAIPLKRLERAAEDIRRGKRDLTELPDLSQRRDEIGELSAILRQMADALNGRIDSIQNFAADVAHEIKNPITSLRSAIETAQNATEKSKRDALLQIMEEDVHRLDHLITDISKHSRLDSELAREGFHVVDLKDLLHEITTFWRNPAMLEDEDERRAQVETDFTDAPCQVLGKGESLAQVFHNLISNALSFTKSDDPIRVIVTKSDKSAQGDEKILVQIEDKGDGVPESRLDKIFQRFYTERPDDHDKSRNSGLGLSIAKQIIDAHQGEIRAENIYDGKKITGARFTVILSEYKE